MSAAQLSSGIVSTVPALGELLHVLHPPREDSFLISLTPLLAPSIFPALSHSQIPEHTDLSSTLTHGRNTSCDPLHTQPGAEAGLCQFLGSECSLRGHFKTQSRNS